MNLYTIGHSDWESWGTITLQHEKLFTKEEFDNVVVDAHIKAFLIEKAKWSGHKGKYTFNSIDNFWNEVPQILIDDYGFKNINIIHNFHVNSMASIKSKQDKDEQMNLIRKKYKELKT